MYQPRPRAPAQAESGTQQVSIAAAALDTAAAVCVKSLKCQNAHAFTWDPETSCKPALKCRGYETKRLDEA